MSIKTQVKTTKPKVKITPAVAKDIINYLLGQRGGAFRADILGCIGESNSDKPVPFDAWARGNLEQPGGPRTRWRLPNSPISVEHPTNPKVKAKKQTGRKPLMVREEKVRLANHIVEDILTGQPVLTEKLIQHAAAELKVVGLPIVALGAMEKDIREAWEQRIKSLLTFVPPPPEVITRELELKDVPEVKLLDELRRRLGCREQGLQLLNSASPDAPSQHTPCDIKPVPYKVVVAGLHSNQSGMFLQRSKIKHEISAGRLSVYCADIDSAFCLPTLADFAVTMLVLTPTLKNRVVEKYGAPNVLKDQTGVGAIEEIILAHVRDHRRYVLA